MSPSEFVQLVYDMRRAQKNYFLAQTRKALVKSKQLEKQVDDWLAGCPFLRKEDK